MAMAAGNATIWKPSPTTSLCSIAVTKIISKVFEENGIPGAVASLVTGNRDCGEAIVESRDVELGMIAFSFRPTSDNAPQCRLLEVRMLVVSSARM